MFQFLGSVFSASSLFGRLFESILRITQPFLFIPNGMVILPHCRRKNIAAKSIVKESNK